jgi:exodeoxyribonuclease-5
MITPNQEQQYIIDRAVEWYLHDNINQIFQYDGPPGSGKSYVLSEIINRLGLNPTTEVAAMSFIGSASLVMRNKGLWSAKTAHSWLFNVGTVTLKDKHGNVIMDTLLNVPIKRPKFIPVDYLDPRIKLIAIDEGYSMPYWMRKEVLKFGIKVIVCGDQYQLPPVNDAPAFLAGGPIFHLHKCMRQMDMKDITFIANRVRAGLPLNNGYYGNSLVINQKDLSDNMLAWADAIICSRNNTRDDINNRVRAIYGYNTALPARGEKVVCRNNNWFESVPIGMGMEINLVNGLIGRVASNPDISTYDGEMFSMNFIPDLQPNVMFANSRCNYLHMVSDNATRQALRKNKYAKGNMFEYAYCLTGYVAQGSQFHNVIYIEENVNGPIQNSMNLVGATRADRALIYVKSY